MRLIVRRLEPGELNHELLWLSVSVGSLACAAIWLSFGLPWPVCVFHALTGHPCATCGATRSAIAFLHGQFFTAWRWNPLASIAFCGLSIFDAYAAIALVMRAPRLRIAHFTTGDKVFLRVMVIALLGLNWLYLLASKSPF
jgi:hypothetical protein